MGVFNGTITAGGTAQTVFAKPVQRFYLRNESTGDLRVTDDGTTPAVATGVLVKAGETLTELRPTSGAIQVWGATTSQAFSGKVD